MRKGWRAPAAAGLCAAGWFWLPLGLLVLVYQCETWFVRGVWPPITLESVLGSAGSVDREGRSLGALLDPVLAAPLALVLIALGLATRLAASLARRGQRETAGIAPAVR